MWFNHISGTDKRESELERFEFRTVMQILKEYKKRSVSVTDLCAALLGSFLLTGQVPDETAYIKWMNGMEAVPEKIVEFYRQTENQKRMREDILENVFPMLVEYENVMDQIRKLILGDFTTFRSRKKLLKDYGLETDGQMAAFLTGAVCYSMNRPFHKHKRTDEKAKRSLPVSENIILRRVPLPCPAFCGRDDELQELHRKLMEEERVTLTGIPGIGKSELAREYARIHRDDYTNILYFSYKGDLKKMFRDLPFVTDVGISGYRKLQDHLNFFRCLLPDTLLIIDNMDTAPEDDPFLQDILGLHCRVLITTRNPDLAENQMELTEIRESDGLLKLVHYYFGKNGRYDEIIRQITDLLHGHTFAVELAARLLAVGVLEPDRLLEKIKEQNIALDSTDRIRTEKDGQPRRGTYYEHLRLLFSLFHLREEETDILRFLSLTGEYMVPRSFLAEFLELKNLNNLESLIQRGLVDAEEDRKVSMKPIVQDVAITETRPAVSNSVTWLKHLSLKCRETPAGSGQSSLVIQLGTNADKVLIKDEKERYLKVLEDLIDYVEEAGCTGLYLDLCKSLIVILGSGEGKPEDQARGWMIGAEAVYAGDPASQLSCYKKALLTVGETRTGNARLVANINAGMSEVYFAMNMLEKADVHLENAISILRDYNLISWEENGRHCYSRDYIRMVTNHAQILGETGKIEEALGWLDRIEQELAELGLENDPDMEGIYFLHASIYLERYTRSHLETDQKSAEDYFKKCLAVHQNFCQDRESLNSLIGRIRSAVQNSRASIRLDGNLIEAAD